MNVAEKFKERNDELRAQGFPSIAEMAFQFDDTKDMSAALGYDRSAADHWYARRTTPATRSERKAREWLASRAAPPPSEVPLPTKPPSGTILMAVCQPEQAAKVMKVLGLLGCEVVEV